MSLFGGCSGCEAREKEITRAMDREVKLLAQISDLQNKLSAIADIRAHLAVTREAEGRPTTVHKKPTLRLPEHINRLMAGGHVKLGDIRKLTKQAKPVNEPPPAAQD